METVTREQSLTSPRTSEHSARARWGEGARVAAGVGDGGTTCTRRAERAPSRGWQRLPVAVFRLLSVAPRVSQRQEQQQRTQAPAQLPPRRPSPARRRRHHQGSSRLLPAAGALSRPWAQLLRSGRRLPSPGRGRRRAGAFAPPARGTGVAGVLGLGGIKLGVGVLGANPAET